MSMRDLLAELEQLSKLKHNWYAVASVFEQIKLLCAGQAESSRRIMEACQASGYTLNTVNRMVAVRAFFDSVKDQVEKLQRVDPNTLSFTSLELAKRLYPVNTKEAIGMLSEIAEGRTTYRDLRWRYNRIIASDTSRVSVHQASKREGVNFENAALEAVRSASEELLGGKNFNITKVTYLSLFSVNAVAHEKDLDDLEDAPIGFNFFYIRPHENLKRRYEVLLHRLAFLTHYFRTVWVVFPSTAGEERIECFSQFLCMLGYFSIGVAMLPWSEDKSAEENLLKIIWKPTSDLPPAWRANLREIEETFSRLTYVPKGRPTR